MDTETETISSFDIQRHMGYWVNMELIRSALTGISPSYRTDEEFLDAFGVSHDYLRIAKRRYEAKSPKYEDYVK